MDDVSLPAHLQSALDDFRKWDDAKRMRDAARKRVIAPLHHYSDMASLIGMLESSRLWLTSIFHLNDPSELTYGMNIAIERLDWHLQQIFSGANASSSAPLLVDIFCQRMEHALKHNIGRAFGFYVASFSRTRDDLGQWRSYADDGRGV